MGNASPYFYIENEIEIDSIEKLMELNKPKIYSELGIEYKPSFPINFESPDRQLFFQHTTSGFFRGQSCDWPLIPSSYRNLKPLTENDDEKFRRMYAFLHDNRELHTFCKFAAIQNRNFPKSTIEQISISQHYGIKTPLLDWSTNILVAAYFATSIKGDEDIPNSFQPCIYHLRDERHLKEIDNSIIKKEISDVNYSALVRPYLLDRRIERQFSVFSFHPHPLHKPDKIPIDKYTINLDFYFELTKLLEGFGYSSAHFFPDYAGLSERIKHEYSI